MEIKKFENYNDYTGFEGIIYYITTNDDKQPWQRQNTTDFDEALRILKRMEEVSISEYCIYKANFKILSKEDIEMYKISSKYNI